MFRSHLSRHHQCVPPLWTRFRSCGQCSSRRIAQSNDQVVETCEDCPWQQGLGHLERGVAAMAHQPGAGLDQPFVEAGERPALDLLVRRQRPQEVRQIVGKSVKAETWTLLTKVETSCDRILIAGGANVEAEWEQGPAV